MIEEIKALLKKHNITLAAHYYEKDEIFDIADITGDSLELAKKCKDLKNPLIFCGVKFMGESAKILNPSIPVYMPSIADCSMARMAEIKKVKEDIETLKKENIDFIPICYVNSSANVKAIVGELGGSICTSSSAEKIINWAIEKNKKIYFLPDQNLGKNTARKLGLKAKVIREENWQEADIICFDGLCSVHQLFMPEHVEFYKERYPDIKIVLHPECSPKVCKMADFIGSTSQILNYVKEHPKETMAIGTEFNFVNRLKRFNPNIYILSSTKPECPSMNETTVQNLYNLLKAIDEGKPYNEIKVEENIAKNALKALNKMMEITK